MDLQHLVGNKGHVVSYGRGVDDESVLKLLGNLEGKRVLELGVPRGYVNAIAIALGGARTIVVDPAASSIDTVRMIAAREGATVECHQVDLADLGDITSAYLDLVLCVDQLWRQMDLNRVLRQVHRVLKPNGSLIVALAHPVGDMFDEGSNVAVRRYGADGSRGVADLFMALRRNNFSVDVVHELESRHNSQRPAPDALVLRAQKLGL